MKKFFAFLFCMLAVSSLPVLTTSCSDDDDDSSEDRTIVADGEETDDSSEETDTLTNEINGHEFVDLGLSVKWATCNVGAERPTDYGDYFAWGEIDVKESYSSSNCVTQNVSLNDISGDATYDAARANWGSSWRLPTGEEIDELVSECIVEYTTIDDVNGCLVTGPNGNSIFLPAAGWYGGTTLTTPDSTGSYWCSTPDESNTTRAYNLFFSSSEFIREGAYRYHGHSVRPVSD